MSADWSWPFWPLVPLYPYGQRRTVRRELVADTIWSFEQLQGILYAIAPIRMTVVRLERWGLLVYAPIAPTPECLRLLGELVDRYGDVRCIFLPTSSGLEHKVFVGPFARKFPRAKVWVAPQQWSFPINLPLSWLGFPPQRTQVLPADVSAIPFADEFISEFDHAVLEIDLGRGTFGEIALLHRPSGTLLLTDTLLAVAAEPPLISQLDPYPLLFHARDRASDPITDTVANRCKGWQRIALFALYFRPSALETIGIGRTLQEANSAPDRSRRAYFGLYPFRWHEDWQNSFAALQGKGHPLVAPVLQVLILKQAPSRVRDWVERIASWQFERIVSCHFSAPIAAGPAEFRKAFAFLKDATATALPAADFAFIKQLEAQLQRAGIATPPREK